MASIIGSPTRYIQGAGELKDLAKHAEKFGTKLFMMTSKSGRGRVEAKIAEGLKETKCSTHYEVFNGECCDSEIHRLRDLCKSADCDVVVGIGGGKILDTAKAVAHELGLPVVIVPTIASTDAPCSALSVIYKEDGVFDRYLFFPSSPNMVLVDTDIITKAPKRLLVSGMGDALATYFEARACAASEATNCVGGKPTRAALALAKLCYDTLLADGLKAAAAVSVGACTKAVENIIEANTYLSGIGFESGGLAGAHAIHNGLTALEETHECYHGEKVAFGTIVQLVLENAPKEELSEVIDFCLSVGLPTCLDDLGVEDKSPDRLIKVAEIAAGPGDTLGNMPFEVTPQSVLSAILAADALGGGCGDEDDECDCGCC